MKLITIIFCLLTLFFQTTYTQDTTAVINSAWVNLKTQIQRRTDIVNTMVNTISRTNKIDKDQLFICKEISTHLFSYVDTLSVKDSLTISAASSENNRLTQALSMNFHLLSILIITVVDWKEMAQPVIRLCTP